MAKGEFNTSLFCGDAGCAHVAWDSDTVARVRDENGGELVLQRDEMVTLFAGIIDEDPGLAPPDVYEEARRLVAERAGIIAAQNEATVDLP